MEASWVIFLVAAGMLLIGVLIVIFDRRKRARCTEETTAMIIGVNRDFSRDDDGHKEYSYTPIFEFSARGVTVRRQGGSSFSRKRKVKVGETKQVRYNPENPNEFVVVGDSGNTGGGVTLIVMSIIIAAVVLCARLGVFDGLH